jgi:hypothetical protein
MDRVWMAHSHKVIDWWRMVRVEKGGPTLHLISEFPNYVGVGDVRTKGSERVREVSV